MALSQSCTSLHQSNPSKHGWIFCHRNQGLLSSSVLELLYVAYTFQWKFYTSKTERRKSQSKIGRTNLRKPMVENDCQKQQGSGKLLSRKWQSGKLQSGKRRGAQDSCRWKLCRILLVQSTVSQVQILSVNCQAYLVDINVSIQNQVIVPTRLKCSGTFA